MIIAAGAFIDSVLWCAACTALGPSSSAPEAATAKLKRLRIITRSPRVSIVSSEALLNVTTQTWRLSSFMLALLLGFRVNRVYDRHGQLSSAHLLMRMLCPTGGVFTFIFFLNVPTVLPPRAAGGGLAARHTRVLATWPIRLRSRQ